MRWQVALDLAEELLPQISTVTLDVEALRGDGTLLPWRRDAALHHGHANTTATATCSRHHHTPTCGGVGGPPELLIVMNPADEAMLIGGGGGEGEAPITMGVRIDDGGGGGGGGLAPCELRGGRRGVPLAALGSLLGGATPWPPQAGGGAARVWSGSSGRAAPLELDAAPPRATYTL